MDSSPSQLLRLLLPKTPFILKTALLHAFYLSPTSSKWDLRTELTIKIIRQMLGPDTKPISISKQQRMTLKDPGVKGRIWISKVKFDVPEAAEKRDELRDVVIKAFNDMGTGQETFTMPDSKSVEAEWTGFRPDVSNDEPEPVDWTEEQKYKALMKEVKHRSTLLYFHGGAMYLLDPATYRATTGKIARKTGGRVLSVRYRLSPQNPFPAALIDALHSYLALLYPPLGSFHSAVPASEIVVGGDSAGGLLSMALLQLILHLHRTKPTDQTLPTVRFHGKDVEVPLPAGLALTSPWLDITRSLPSIEEGTRYDYLPPPSHVRVSVPPPCPVWPSNPPRADMYGDGSALCHPLVSPLAAKDWKCAPPILIVTGEEMLSDEDKVIAQRISKQGGVISWLQFEAMPHCFNMMMEWLGESRMAWNEYAGFVKNVVEGNVTEGGWFVEAKSLKKREVDIRKLTELTDQDVDRLMEESRRKMEEGVRVPEAVPML